LRICLSAFFFQTLSSHFPLAIKDQLQEEKVIKDELQEEKVLPYFGAAMQGAAVALSRPAKSKARSGP
jgi:hypothetical protein